MQYQRFIELVREYSGLPSEEEAAGLARAVLITLGERISRTEREQLAAQLPNELKSHLFERNATDRFTLEEFYDRVSARAATAHPHSVVLARAVMRVLKEAVTPGQMEDILAELPAEYAELFGKEPGSPASPTSLTTRQAKHLDKSGPSHKKTAQ